ncbi:WcaI family glycosyltransferase [Brevundimonas sp.]|uniref:WcaI family glycosyltransferase n=1 Tax=Brevundimonas sp. TaxID=1871086 RepID=UPI00262913D1|nr:WcaI family glycosyltransferase [Brevundimonas sp.]
MFGSAAFAQLKAEPLAAPEVRVLVVALNYSPEVVGCAKYTTELVDDLIARAYQVEVVTAPPYYPNWQIQPGFSGARWCHDHVNGVPVHRTPLYVPVRPTGLRRLAHLASFGAVALPTAVSVARRFKPDLVFAVAPALSCAVAALAAARVCGARTWLHIQDFEVDAAFDLGILKQRQVRDLALWSERSLLTRFDRVSTISPQMVRRLGEKGIPADRVREFRNWVDVDAVQVFASTNTRYRQELGIAPDRVVALYSGNMAGKQGLEMIAEAARRLDRAGAPVTFVLCGGGPARGPLEAACTGLADVRFLDLQPSERLPELLGTADIHLLPQRPEAADLVMPSKLLGMLASGRPIVGIAEPGTGIAAEIADCGLAVPATADALADAIAVLAADPERRRTLGAAGRLRAEGRWRQASVIDGFEREALSLLAQPRK